MIDRISFGDWIIGISFFITPISGYFIYSANPNMDWFLISIFAIFISVSLAFALVLCGIFIALVASVIFAWASFFAVILASIYGLFYGLFSTLFGKKRL